MSKDVTTIPKLGITYTTDFLKKALATKPTNSSKKYVLVGLLFKKIVEKEFKVEALFFNNEMVDTFNSEEIEESDLIEYLSNMEEKIENNGSTARMDQSRLKKLSKVEFWEEETDSNKKNEASGPFVFFSKNCIELLIAGDVKKVSFSGAKINYGNGIREFRKPGTKGVTSYPTLKAESNLGHSTSNEYIPNVILGLPCPPLWSDDGEERSLGNVPFSDNNFLFEMKKNYEKYSEPTRSIGSSLNLKQMATKWNSFVERVH